MKPLLILVMAWPLNLAAQTAHPLPTAKTASAATDTTPSIKVEVKLVNVFTTVTDASTKPLRSLTQNDFELYEDGVPQKIAVFDRQSNLPLSIVLAIDASLSTRDDLKFETDSARRFARDVLRPENKDALAVYQFEREVSQLTPFTGDLPRINRGLDSVHVGSTTSLYDAIYLGAQVLDPRRGRKVMVVITDGGDTGSSVSYQEALRAAQQAEAMIYSIIVVPIEASAGRNTGGEHALIQLSNDSGGKYYYAASLPLLDQAFRQISDELRTQYLLAYYPSKRLSDSDFRRIEVKLRPETLPKDQPLSIRYRTGYFTSKTW